MPLRGDRQPSWRGEQHCRVLAGTFLHGQRRGHRSLEIYGEMAIKYFIYLIRVMN